MNVKGQVRLSGTKTFLEPKFSLFIVKFKKLGFSATLNKAFDIVNLPQLAYVIVKRYVG